MLKHIVYNSCLLMIVSLFVNGFGGINGYGYELPKSSESKLYVFEKSKSNSVEFRAIGNPGFLTIHGSGGHVYGEVKADDKGISADLYVQLKDFTTGIDLRDKHMREKYLLVDQYPRAHLVIESLTYSHKDGEEFPWTGKLTLKGNTKPVHGKAIVNGKSLKANFKVLISDYPEIGVPSWLGVTMAESVDVKVNAVAK